MKSATIASTVALLLIFGQILLAAPQPPLYVVNHSTKECATIMGGDECMDCYPLEGWQVVARGDGWCPDGYAQAQNVGSRCEHIKDQFCCSEGHSGAAGNCKDLIIHDQRKQCAFADSIDAAVLPKGWEAMPEDESASRWSCPNHYEWVGILEPAPTQGPAASEVPRTKEPETTDPISTEEPEATEVTRGGETDVQDTRLPCLGALLLAPAAMGLIFVSSRERGVGARSMEELIE